MGQPMIYPEPTAVRAVIDPDEDGLACLVYFDDGSHVREAFGTMREAFEFAADMGVPCDARWMPVVPGSGTGSDYQWETEHDVGLVETCVGYTDDGEPLVGYRRADEDERDEDRADDWTDEDRARYEADERDERRARAVRDGGAL
jgi:hypothetical protein